jgi:hypothetical protein
VRPISQGFDMIGRLRASVRWSAHEETAGAIKCGAGFGVARRASAGARRR